MEIIRPSAGLSNDQMKAKLELLQMLAEADEDIREGRVADMSETFSEVREMLEARRAK